MSGTSKKAVDVAFKAGKTIDWEGMAKLIVSDEARKEFANLRRAFDEVNGALQTKFSQEPEPVDWGYYRNVVGSRVVDMYKEAYESIEIPKYVDTVTPQYKPKFDALMGKSASDDKILSYNDVVLRRSDLDILSGPHFLNDRIIEFYSSYLSFCYPSGDILLVPPSIAFWLTNCPNVESLKDFVEPLNLPSRKLIMFPVNNNEDVEQAEGGSHWSLLAFERNVNVFVHHDSCGGLNAGHAKRLYRAVVGYVGTVDSVSSCKFVECLRSPQQENGYDCGFYALAIAEALCSWFKNGGPRDEDGLWYSLVNERVNSSVVGEMRSEILRIIRSLMIK